jgi:hypothetical protein
MGVIRTFIAFGFLMLFFWPQQIDAQRKRSLAKRQEVTVLASESAPIDTLSVLSEEKMSVIDTLPPLADLITQKERIDALFLLPFREDRLPYRDSLVIDSLYSTETPIDTFRLIDTLALVRQIELRRDMQTALELYYGIVFAIDSARSLGLEVNPRFVDTELSPSQMTDFARRDTVKTDMVFGPVSARVVRAYIEARADSMIPLFAPFLQPEEGLKGRIYFGSTVADQMRKKMLSYALEQYRGERVFLIADSAQEKAKSAVKSVFEEAHEVRLINDLAIEQLPEFRDSIVDSLIPNWALLETTQSGLAASIISILNGINAEPKKSMRVFSTTPSVVYFNDQVNPTHLSALVFAYPEIYGRPTPEFVKSFNRRFGFNPSINTTRAFDLTLDGFYRVLVERIRSQGDTNQLVTLKQQYAGSDIDYLPFGSNAYQNVAYRLKWVRDLSFSELDTTIPPEVFKPWPELPDTWLADRLLAIEKMRYPERFDENGERIEEELN